MVSFSIKPGGQTDKSESPNYVNKAELIGEYQSFSQFLLGILRNFKLRGLLTDLKQHQIKELLAGSDKFLAKVLPVFSKLETGVLHGKTIYKSKVGEILLCSFLILVGILV